MTISVIAIPFFLTFYPLGLLQEEKGVGPGYGRRPGHCAEVVAPPLKSFGKAWGVICRRRRPAGVGLRRLVGTPQVLRQGLSVS